MHDGVFSIPLSVELPDGDFEIEYAAPAAKTNGKTVTIERSLSASALTTAAKSASTTALKSASPNGQHSGTKATANSTSVGKANRTSIAELARRPLIKPTSDFLVGSENRLLAEAVQSILSKPPSPYNPLLLCGPPGSGKTHIARGLVAAWAAESRSSGVVLTNGADFARQFAAALEQTMAHGSLAPWRERMRGSVLFVLEDFNQLGVKRAAQTELLHTIDAIQSHDGQVVLTSRLPIDKINGLPAALLSRLSAGLCVQLALPSAAVRLALIERYATLREIALPANAARLLADGLSVTVPELYGTLHELHVASTVEHRGIDAELVRRHLQDRRAQIQPTVRSITSVSAKYFGLKVTELTGPTRRRAVVQARNVAIFLSRQLAGKSLEQLGTFFGGRDHTTVLHSYRTIEERYRTDPNIRRAVSDLRKMLAHA